MLALKVLSSIHMALRFEIRQYVKGSFLNFKKTMTRSFDRTASSFVIVDSSSDGDLF